MTVAHTGNVVSFISRGFVVLHICWHGYVLYFVPNRLEDNCLQMWKCFIGTFHWTVSKSDLSFHLLVNYALRRTVTMNDIVLCWSLLVSYSFFWRVVAVVQIVTLNCCRRMQSWMTYSIVCSASPQQHTEESTGTNWNLSCLSWFKLLCPALSRKMTTRSWWE